MKYSILLLLTVFAFSAQAFINTEAEWDSSNQYELWLKKSLANGSVNDVIEKILKKLRDAVENGLKKLEEVALKVAQQVQRLLEAAQRKVEDIFNKIQDKLDEWANENETVRKCVDEYRPAVNETLENAHKELNKCHDTAVEGALKIKNKLQSEKQEVSQLVNEIQSIIKNCSDNSSTYRDFIGCVFSKLSEIQEKAAEIVQKVKNSVIEALQLARQVETEAGQCVHDTVLKAQEGLSKATQGIQECIENSQNEIIEY